MNTKKLTKYLVVGLVAAFLLTAGSCNDTQDTKDQKNTDRSQSQLAQSQPVHTYTHSQIRQTLQDAEDIEADGVKTWTYGFEMGIPHPVFSCPSIGLPVPATDELTNPLKVSDGGNAPSTGDGNTSIGQPDPTGVYAGNTNATYVLCVADNGEKYLSHVEGEVFSFTVKQTWDPAQQMLVPADGAKSSKKIGTVGG